MISKIKVYASVLDRSFFTIADTAELLNLPGPTVRSVIDRLPDGWLTSQKKVTGKRGGSPLVYSLSEEGRAGIRRRLGELPVPAEIFQASPETPLGLIVAEDLLASAANAEHSRSARLLARAQNNLEWASAEISSLAGDKHGGLLARLDRAKNVLIQRSETLIEARQTTLHERADQWAIDVSAEEASPILVISVGDDDGAEQLADRAELSLRSLLHASEMLGEQPAEPRVRIKKCSLIWHDFEHLLAPPLGRTSPSVDASVYVVCVDSSKHLGDIDRMFHRVRGQPLYTPVGYVLDIGHNNRLSALAHEQRAFHYAPGVDRNLEWMDRNMLGICGFHRRIG